MKSQNNFNSRKIDLSKVDVRNKTKEDFIKSINTVHLLFKIQYNGLDENSVRKYHDYRMVIDYLEEEKILDKIFENR